MISSISRNAASRRAEKTARENLSTLIPQELRAQYIDNQPGSMATKVDQAALAYITMLQNEINVKDQEATNRGRRIRCMTRVMDYFGLTVSDAQQQVTVFCNAYRCYRRETRIRT